MTLWLLRIWRLPLGSFVTLTGSNLIKRNDILVEAYSPIAHGAVLDHAEVKVVAEKYGVSVAQLCLRYDIQLGLVVIPKTANPDHMRINAELHFVISDADMESLKM